MDSTLNPELSAFICAELRVAPERLRPDTQLLRDLGLDGADATELMESYAGKFGVDMGSFESTRYFGPEAGFSPLVWLWSIFRGAKTNLTPLTLADLQASLEARRWIDPSHAAV